MINMVNENIIDSLEGIALNGEKADFKIRLETKDYPHGFTNNICSMIIINEFIPYEPKLISKLETQLPGELNNQGYERIAHHVYKTKFGKIIYDLVDTQDFIAFIKIENNSDNSEVQALRDRLYELEKNMKKFIISNGN